MKIGIIGLGDICVKAYLPVITALDNVELVFCTRNKEKLEELARKYHVEKRVSTIEELISCQIDAAFIHTATESHVEIAEMLLGNGIHVYVDKPISYTYEESKRISQLAEDMGKILMVGFNRRFAPMYKGLKEYGAPDIILMEKNRFAQPGEVETFILDDFIHVVDTLRFLLDKEVDDMRVQGLKKDGLLYNVIITLFAGETTAIGMMNRDNGVTEEVVEYMSAGKKIVVKDVVQTTHFAGNKESLLKFNDWDATLYKRGFSDIVDTFLQAVEKNEQPSPSICDSLRTHELCQQIIDELK